MDEAALLSCLAVQPRDRFSFVLGGNPDPKCGVPPFDRKASAVRLWSWPWTEWPLYDPEVFERDVDRIERWYRARGYYDARVQSSEVETIDDTQTVSIVLQLREGLPVLVHGVELEGIDTLPPEDQAIVRRAVTLQVGERFDEALYDQNKQALVRALSEASYARVRVEGRVSVDPSEHRADVHFLVQPGPRHTFGTLRVEGNGDLPARAILGAAGLPPGRPYSDSALDDAQVAIYAMGPFSSVELVAEPREDAAVVDVVARVTPGKLMRYGLGIGMLVGNPYPDGLGALQDSVSMWDLHLSAHVEHRNFLGGMRRLRLEERPRLVFTDTQFPQIGPNSEDRNFGNLLVADFRQPAFLESRTQLVAGTRWDWGPDPFEFFTRHDLNAWVGPERSFFRGKLHLSSTLHHNLHIPVGSSLFASAGEALARRPVSQTYNTTYLQHDVTVDLRDDPIFTRSGAFFRASLQQAGYFMPSTWDYLRFAPEARGFLPLPAGMVLAARARIGIMHISRDNVDRCNDEDGRPRPCVGGDTPNPDFEDLANLGPVAHRLRGGGQNSVRGYLPNTLGDAVLRGRRLVSGGLRQWEASVELRVPVTLNFGTVFFFDVGDVTRETHFNFEWLHASAGFGLRYRTLVGPLRLDLGYRIPGLQNIGTTERPQLEGTRLSDRQRGNLFGLPIALHITIGESF